MGTALTEEERIQQLRELVEEYVTYLDLWEKVEVEKVTRTIAKIPKLMIVRDSYGIDNEVLSHDEVKIPPSPYIVIRYYQPKGKWKDRLQATGHETTEFPMCEIVRRIVHYKYKLKKIKEKTS
jgi:hypothetical protein